MPKLLRPSFKLFTLERLLYTAGVPKLVFQPVSWVQCITQARPFSRCLKYNSSFSKLPKSYSLEFWAGLCLLKSENLTVYQTTLSLILLRNFGVKYVTGYPILAWLIVNL